MCTRSGLGAAARFDGLLAADQVGRQRQPAVDVGVSRHDGHQMQFADCPPVRARTARRPASTTGTGPPDRSVAWRAGPPSSSRGRCCVRRAARSRTRSARPGRCAAPARRAARTAADRAAAPAAAPASGPRHAACPSSHAIGESMSSGAGSFHRSRNVVSSAPTTGPCTRSCTSCHGGWSPYCFGHLHAPAGRRGGISSSRREWHRSMPPANATSRSGCAAVPDHHQLLVMRTAEPDALVQQHLAACPLDRLAEMLVLLLAVGELVQVRAPHQPLDDDAALGRLAEQLPDGRAVVAHLLVGVAAPVGEEQVVALAERLDLGRPAGRNRSRRGSAARRGCPRTRRESWWPGCLALPP